MRNALTIDVEDYFQVNAFASHIRPEDWDAYPLRVEGSTMRLLEMFERYDVRATFFILGWVAQRLPQLVREIHSRGHEIACHGYWHQLIYSIGRDSFRQDIRKAKAALEEICGETVIGYRAPSYSITEKSLWALEILVEEGFQYDSSIFPVRHDTYGIPGAKRFPHPLDTPAGTVQEFPPTTYPLTLAGRIVTLPIAGGGYLRLLPVSCISKGIRHVNLVEGQPAVIYFHPWEIDTGQPRIRSSLKSRFRHYLNIYKMEEKIEYLLREFAFAPMRSVLQLP